MSSFGIFWVLNKLQRLLFALIWRLFLLIYFLIGLSALGVVFLIEAQFFAQITQHPYLGYGIAGLFEIAKIGTSLIRQAMLIANHVTRVKVSAVVQAFTGVFQVALILVSLTCSVIVVTAYLEGNSPSLEQLLGHERTTVTQRTSGVRQQPVVTTTLNLLNNGLRLKVKPETFSSVFALVISLLFQAMSFIVFSHLIAMQAREIEHLFEVKLSRAEAKKNFGLSS